MQQNVVTSPGQTDEGSLELLRSELADQQALLQVFEGRYNQEHQRGLSLELMNKRLEARIARLEQENAGLRADAAKPAKQSTPKPTQTKE